jgi:hypothetical protein
MLPMRAPALSRSWARAISIIQRQVTGAGMGQLTPAPRSAGEMSQMRKSFGVIEFCISHNVSSVCFVSLVLWRFDQRLRQIVLDPFLVLPPALTRCATRGVISERPDMHAVETAGIEDTEHDQRAVAADDRRACSRRIADNARVRRLDLVGPHLTRRGRCSAGSRWTGANSSRSRACRSRWRSRQLCGRCASH